jgi:hypothetical protein
MEFRAAENRRESLRIVRQSGDSGADWRSYFKGLRQIPYAAGAGNLLTGAGNFFIARREFMGRGRECPYSAGFVESIYS